MKEKIEKSWAPEIGMFPSDEEISHAKWLIARAILDKDIIMRVITRCKRIRNCLNDSALVCGASLAQHGLLGELERLKLHDDLSFVPAQHLASLVSCVTKRVTIENVSGCDLVSIFTSLKCEELEIWKLILGREETQALVQAMESGVEVVNLCGEVTLDIGVLTEYNGQGRCRHVELFHETAARYREEIRVWARSIKMRITQDSALLIILDKKKCKSVNCNNT